MYRPLFCVVFAGLAFHQAGAAARGQEPATLKKVATIEGITEYKLDNGLRVLLLPDPSQPKITINMTVLVGSRHEGYGEAGMAHLLEHMLFKGTPKHPHIDKLLEAHGAAGNYDASTAFDRTNYFETMPAGDANLEFGIKLEADRLVNSTIRREDLVSEMSVVRNEFEKWENMPGKVLREKMLASAYEWHNYGKGVCGNRADIERVPIDSLHAFYKKYYRTDNTVLVVAGKFDEAKAVRYIERYFGAIPRPQGSIAATYTEEPPQDGERVVHVRRVGDVSLVGVMFHIPAAAHPEFPAAQVLSNILTNEPSGRLYEALVKTKKAVAVYSDATAWHDPGVLFIVAVVPSDGSREGVRDLIIEAVEKTVNGVSDREVERAQRSLLSLREQTAAQTATVAMELSEWAAQGDWRFYFVNRDRLEKVTAADVKTVASKYLKRNNRTVGMFIPTKQAERVAVPATPDYKSLVAAYKGRETAAKADTFDPNPANIEKSTTWTTLPTGLKVALLPKKSTGDMVMMHLSLNYGTAEGLKGYDAACVLMPQLLVRGSKKLTFQQINDELNKFKSGVVGSGNAGVVNFQVETKRQHLPEVLEILRQMLREPALRADEFEVLRANMLTYMEAARKDPAAQASQALSRRLSRFPKGDIRYAPTLDEAVDMFKTVTLEQVQTLYRECLGAEHGELAIVGDFDAGATLKTFTAMMADWKATKAYTRLDTSVQGQFKAVRDVLETPDKDNANYNAGLMLAMNSKDRDWAALAMANRILGGGPTSRLFQRLREKEGLCYNVSSSFNASSMENRASLQISAIANPTNMPKTEKYIMEELVRFWKDGVTKDELDRELASLIQQQSVMLASDATLASTLSASLYTGRKVTEFLDLERFKALTPEALHEAFRRHIDPARLVVVVAGDFAKNAPAARASK